MNLCGIKDEDYDLSLKEALSEVLKLKTPLTEPVAILCGDGISLDKVSQAAAKHGYGSTVFPPAPSDNQMQQLRAWLKGTGGLLVTSNLQFSGMEASTCVFITNNIVEETGARSGLLRATARLVVVSYTKDVDLEEAKKRFIVHDHKGLGLRKVLKKVL